MLLLNFSFIYLDKKYQYNYWEGNFLWTWLSMQISFVEEEFPARKRTHLYIIFISFLTKVIKNFHIFSWYQKSWQLKLNISFKLKLQITSKFIGKSTNQTYLGYQYFFLSIYLYIWWHKASAHSRHIFILFIFIITYLYRHIFIVM